MNQPSPSRPLLDVPTDLVGVLHTAPSFLLLGHLEPDADCVGSQSALASCLRRMGKDVVLANPGPFERQEIQPYEAEFSTDPRLSLPPNTVAVVMDCSSPDRIRPFDAVVESLDVVVIDHHRTAGTFGHVRFIRPDVPANTILVTAIIEELTGGPTEEEAARLFLGLATDTGFFRFVEGGDPIAFEAAARLTRAGASPRAASEHLSGGRSWGSRRLIGRMLARTERLVDGTVLLTHMTRMDEREFGTRRDSDALYRLLLAIEDVRVVAVVKEKERGCTISFRANDETDVSLLAAEFGGGGHQKASGAFSENRIDEVLATLRARMANLHAAPSEASGTT